MYRRVLELVLVCISLAQWGWAQEVRILNRTVQAHGFVSQGFVSTNQNNWLTMNTTGGSGAMTEMGLNVSSQITDKFRVGAQVYDRNFGATGPMASFAGLGGGGLPVHELVWNSRGQGQDNAGSV
jgi:hypothetical protein